MDPTWVVLTALAFGIFLGAAFMIVLHMAERRGSNAAKVVAPSIPDGVDQVLDVLESAGVVLDPSNNVLRASPGALAMGLVRQQALVHPELLELVGSVRRGGEPVVDEVTVARGPFGDSTLRLHVRVARLGTRFVLLLAEDRTEAHRLDEVRRDFVANISHELKTPIASVSLLAEALDQAADEPEQVRRFAGRLSVEAARLAHITSEVIELSRLQARDALRPDRLVRVDEVIAAAVDQNRIVAGAKDVEVVVRASTKAEVYGDRDLLVVAVHNLIANAIAYSNPSGRVGVGAKTDGDVVEIAVTDQGIGIDADDLERVFERFYRVDQARSRNTGGSGLGLSIVKHTVQNHGGDVRVWSQPGRGATFMIRLPLAEAAIEPETADADPDTGSGARRRTDAAPTRTPKNRASAPPAAKFAASDRGDRT
ncbi:two-component sensor histidine kinase [Agromyces badenianii]|uniref:Sensor-like histidine kinase SenX3 n=1 Tax=Agromyces badenianii TaxID=2080742 RepID=A0A2S0WXK9_9MICO|nr:ATP-binding protein [Agromyces badenianii]AWB96083.1 two-component sensor histidine kinase [Agromyces badenianii]PWC04945.1 two-component sensor histidine kinase [Agromyces badenianii]